MWCFNSLSIATSCSIKEANWLMNKGMCVLIFDVFENLLLRKTDVFKTCRKSRCLGKKIGRNALVLKSKKVQGIFAVSHPDVFWYHLNSMGPRENEPKKIL